MEVRAKPALPPLPPRMRAWAARLSWSVAAAALGPAATVLLCSISVAAAHFAFALLFPWVFAAFVVSHFALMAALERRWQAALPLAIYPLATLLLVLNYGSVLRFAMDTGEHIHFRVERAAYLAAIAKLPADDGHRLAIFPLGISDWQEHAVVFDESDGIVAACAAPSAAWLTRVKGTKLACGVMGAVPLGGHFYMTRIAC